MKCWSDSQRVYKMKLKKGFMMKNIKLICTFAFTSLLVACGGGGGGSTGATNTSLTVSGVAATGAAISGGAVEAKCVAAPNSAATTSTVTGSATTNADGSYSLSVSNAAQPCILKATDPVSKLELHSLLDAGSTTANITPITNLVVANAVGDDPTTAFSNFSQTHQQKITSSNITTAVANIKALTAELGTDADMSSVDIMKGNFTPATANAAGDASDKKIDALMAALAASDKTIAELSAQLKAVTNTTGAATTLNSVVGSAKYSLESCPYARSGDVWVLDFIGTAPASFNVNFNTMVLTKLADNTTSAINFKRNSANAVIPCAFTATVGGASVEFRVSESGIGAWTQANDFGITVPVQKSNALNKAGFIGSYPTMAFLREKTLGYRDAMPFNFVVDSNGEMNGYTCDLTKSKPDCLTATTASGDKTTCTAQSNGTLSCTSPDGLSATAILYLTGNQATMFMAVTNMSSGIYRFGGLMVMNKAPTMQLPKAGDTQAAGYGWYTGVDNGSNTVVAGLTSAIKIETVDSSNNSYTSSSNGTTTTVTSYLDTPAKGFGFLTLSTGHKSVAIGSPSGWSIQSIKSPTGTTYDGWIVGIRGKR